MGPSASSRAALSPEAELAAFIAGLDGDGAVVSFVGLARPRTRRARR